MDIVRAHEVRIDPELGAAAAHVRERGLGGLLHHVAELAGEAELAAPPGDHDLDEEEGAPGRRPAQPGDHARPRLLLGQRLVEAGRPEDPPDVRDLDRRRRRPTLGEVHGDVPED